MIWFGFALLLLVLAAVAWVAVTYTKIGQLAYASGGAFEARQYGFRAQAVDIGEMPMVIYDGGPRDAKETIVLLHGYSADKQVWPRFARHLLDRYRVIIPDLAGHGDTGYQASWDYSAPAQARRVAALLDKLGITRTHIGGNSMGGFIAAHFALAYPDRTLSLAVVDPAGVTSPEPSDVQKMLLQGRNPFEVHSRAEFDAFYAMTMARPPWLPGFMLAAISMQYQARRPELAKIFRDFHEHDMLDGKLADIHAPTLVLWGRKDRVIHVSSAEVWAQGLPHAQLVIEEGIGHMPMVERPAQTAAIYRDFLNSKNQSGKSP